ncbi:MAG: glucan 1,4-alpha-glucosidase [Bacteroidetes bacterium]|nr:glucan 1,4-alpha-glucosidase [Bacteroidota bacterium]
MVEKLAPGFPGIPPKWTSSAKTGIGKSINAASEVTFTISHGVLNEIYYPREDTACIRDMELIITDGDSFFSEEKRATNTKTKMLIEGIPAYHIINTCREKKFQIDKYIVADPLRDTVLQKIIFKPLGKSETPFQLFALIAPHLNNRGSDNTGWVGEYKGVPVLYAQRADTCLAMICSTGWKKRSVGYVGTSDGWQDLNMHKKMEWDYTIAENGNIALTGEIDLAISNSFTIAIGFGSSPSEAAHQARASLLQTFEAIQNEYVQEWIAWHKGLANMKMNKLSSGKKFRASASILKMNMAKSFAGGILASLSIPWGQSKGDDDLGGYHLVWPRDLVESAGGLLALNAQDDALNIINYLMTTQQADGSWSQNMWLDGTPYWKAMQLDQVALPVLLVDTCHHIVEFDKGRLKRYWLHIKNAIGFIINTGPYTQQDRWEEESGYSPFTIATQIAALLAAAHLAEEFGEMDVADYCRNKADDWNDRIEEWTYVEQNDLAKKMGVDGYYLRINPENIPANELGQKKIILKNHRGDNGTINVTDLISTDALALVRFGLREPDDPRILNTIKIIDHVLKLDTPSGPCWHRYNEDGYGEDDQGNDFPSDGNGKGRAWPLLTGERGHYEVAAGNFQKAAEMLRAMESFANNDMLPEQIWDADDIPQKELYFAKHTGSAMPLTWAHAEYLKLAYSIKTKKIFDMPRHTKERYLENKTIATVAYWSFSDKIKKIKAGKRLCIETSSPAIIYWSIDHWLNTNHTEVKDIGLPFYFHDFELPGNASKFEFTFFWKDANKWEGENFEIEVK